MPCPEPVEAGPQISPARRSYTAVSLAYSNASHFTPALRKFTCTRASAPLPSRLTITPSPNLVWNTAWPLRQPSCAEWLRP